MSHHSSSTSLPSSISSSVLHHHKLATGELSSSNSSSSSLGPSAPVSSSGKGGSSACVAALSDATNSLASSQNHQTNGGSLEDSHANFFSLTDVCGIKWSILRQGNAKESSSSSVLEAEEPLLESYGRCLEAELLVVWRYSGKTSEELPFNYENPLTSPNPSLEGKKKCSSRCKELWLFWYGDKPGELLKRLCHPSLEEVSSGTWEEGGLPYEARIHLFKALNNLIERSLLRKDLVRLGKWFVQPLDCGASNSNAKKDDGHLSFSFQYFVHGESTVCASLDVRQHPSVRRLSLHHLSHARANPLRVILAPYGLAATLTGVSLKASDSKVASQLQKWRLFYLLEKNTYYCLDAGGELVSMPPAVEVSVAGVKLIYPTSYVLVTDIDHQPPLYEASPSMRTFRRPEDLSSTTAAEVLLPPTEPSAYSASHHPLLHAANAPQGTLPGTLIQETWMDGLRPQRRPNDFLSHWDLSHPGRLGKKKLRSRSKEKSGRLNRLYNPKVPFHARMEPLEDLGWMLDQAELCNGGGRLALPPGRVVNKENQLHSPKKAPYEMMSPAPQQSNGPATPSGDVKQPRTPLLPTYPGMSSPYVPHTSTGSSSSTSHAVVKVEEPNNSAAASSSSTTNTTSSSSSTSRLSLFSAKTDSIAPSSSTCLKRPALPVKDYEDDGLEEQQLSDSIYDYRSMRAWLNHPVKKPRMTDPPLKPPPAGPTTPQQPNSATHSRPNSNNNEEASFGDQKQPMPSGNPSSPTTLKQQNNLSASENNQDECNNTNNNNNASNNSGPLPNGVSNPEQQQAPFHQFDENGDPFDFSDDKNKQQQSQNDEDKRNWLTSDGLKPSINDLDNLFDDSSDETEASGGGLINPTPPNSNKSVKEEEDSQTTPAPSAGGKFGGKGGGSSKIDPTGNLPHDQLAKMFPTPPSHDHNPIASPADEHFDMIKTETPGSPWVPLQQQSSGGPAPALSDMSEVGGGGDFDLAATKFGPLRKLYSDELPALKLPPYCIYKPNKSRSNNSAASQQQQNSMQFRDGSSHGGGNTNNTSSGPLTPGGLGMKPGMSPISPCLPMAEGGPRSHHSNYGLSPSPAPYKKNTPHLESSSPDMKNSISSSSASASRPILADSLVLNLILSETLLNIFRDHNFDSCTMCVCSNDGNIKGRDAALYLKPEFSSGDEEVVNCTCGYSAIINRRSAYQSGLFYEDESEVTSITEDLYFRKKPSLLMLLNNDYSNNNSGSNNGGSRHGNNSPPANNNPPAPNNNNSSNSNNAGSNNASANGGSNNASGIVDAIPGSLLELLTKQVSFPPSTSSFDSILKYSESYLKSSSASNRHSISMVELMDGNDVIFLALDQVKKSGSKLDESQKETCLHKWTLLQAEGPYCSDDIIRVMKSLQPILNDSIHVRRASPPGVLSVQGPLTWRQFHRMAGPSTKGNTDDQVEPLPVPTVTVGHEKDFLSLSPLALHFWEGLSLEPFAHPRDVAYIVVCPDNELILGSVKDFFRNLSSIYEMCHLGKHVPITQRLKDGVLKVGRSAAVKLADSDVEEWFRLIGDSHIAALLKLYAQVCRHFLLPHLNTIPFDRSLLRPEKKPEEKTGVMAPPSSTGTMNEGLPKQPQHQPTGDLLNEAAAEGGAGKEGGKEGNASENASSSTNGSPDDPDGGDPPAIVIYMVDPFSMDSNLETSRLTALGLLRCFNQLLPSFNEGLKHNIYLQLVSLESLLELGQSGGNSRMRNQLKGLAFSVYSQAYRPLSYNKECKSLTGFGPASNSERYLLGHEEKLRLVRPLHMPSFILSSPLSASTSEDPTERSTVLFINYCLSEDQHWLLASCSDDRGELLKTVVINIEIPNKSRRKKASARRVGLGKLMDWILGVMAMSLTPWRLVIGRLGRIGHGELRGWSVLLSRASLKKASKQLREMCSWSSDVPSILSACLVSLEPDSHLRVMADQFTADERFGKAASNCQLSTPKDVSCTHILVFPTSATAQSTQVFREHQDGMGLNSNEFEFDLPNLEDINSGDDGGMEINFGDLFEESYDDQQLSPGGSPGQRHSSSQPSSPSGGKGDSATFRYGQEEPGERIEILQQPLALGYLVSTAKTGTMPRWFWASCPHLQHVSPVFLKSALHINVTSILSGVDDGLAPQAAASGRVHSLDSSYTTDVLRHVLEGYNALSWLSLDSVTHDRQSCLPIHVQVLTRMYGALASLL